jgi:hypothetical protein
MVHANLDENDSGEDGWDDGRDRVYVNNLRFFLSAISSSDVSTSYTSDVAGTKWYGDEGGGGNTLTTDAVGQDGTKGSGGGGGGSIMITTQQYSSMAIPPTNPGGKGGAGYCMIRWYE